MKRQAIPFIIVTLLLLACQGRQYFTACPEIDLVKKGNEAYLKGDWETFRSLYADTARIWDNTWYKTAGMTPDQYTEASKIETSDYASYKMGDDPIYEMIVTDDGDKWVHNWMLWNVTTKGGKQASVPISISVLVKENKIIYQANIFNALPTDQTPQDSTKMAH